MRRTWSPPGPFRIGDRVKVSTWNPPIVGEVIEDRGLIGHERRHYYTVRLPVGEPDERMIVGYPADMLKLATAEEVAAQVED